MSHRPHLPVLVPFALAAGLVLSASPAMATGWPEEVMTPCRSIDFHAGCVLQPIPVPFGNLTDAEQDAIASQLIGNEMRAIPEREEYGRRVEAFEKAEKAAEGAAQTPAQEEAREVEARKVFPSTSYPRIQVESARPLRVTWLSFSEEAVPRVQRGTPHEVAVVQELAKKMGYAVTVDAKLRQKPFSNGALCLGCTAGPWYRGRYGEMRTFGHSFILSTPWLSRRPRTTAADAARALATLRAVRPRDPSSRPDPPRLVVFRSYDGSARLAWAVPYVAGLVCLDTRTPRGYTEHESTIVYALDVENLSILTTLSASEYYAAFEEAEANPQGQVVASAAP